MVFKMEDQLDFAELSGDYNPIHVDPESARRRIHGTIVVHGVHSVLCALESWLADGDLGRVSRLKVHFHKPIFLEREVVVAQKPRGSGLTLDLRDDGLLLARVAVEFSDEPLMRLEVREPPEDVRRDPLPGPPRQGESGSLPLYLNSELARRRFPRLARANPRLVAEVMATTRLVGMECPGMRSIFTSLDLRFGCEVAASMAYTVEDFDPRFNRVTLKTSHPQGTILAFSPQPGPSQPTFDEVRSQVAVDEFQDQVALVVGGSRGLGELTAKIVAAGGGRVVITYHQGEQDALRVAEDIGARCQVLRWNVLDGGRLALLERPTHLYYFATPQILQPRAGFFQGSLFEKFAKFYLDGFARVLDSCLNSQKEELSVLYPSTVFLDERPKDFIEYCMSKAAGEQLCASLEACHENLSIYVPRLPKLATDQTAQIHGEESPSPLPVMLEAVRKLSGPGRKSRPT